MSTLEELTRLHSNVEGEALEHLQRLLAAWRLISDLSFSDLILMVPIEGEEGARFVVVGQVRPTTGQTLYAADLVGQVVSESERPAATRALRRGEVIEAEAAHLGDGSPLTIEAIPVVFRHRTIAVLCREFDTLMGRRVGELERCYTEVYDDLVQMIVDGTFPFAREDLEIEGAPRVGDGVIVLDADARIRYASPNAVSSLHRIGIHAYISGTEIKQLGFDEGSVDNAMRGRLPVLHEIERSDSSVLMRIIPLLEELEPVGALLLMRDVTDLRRRDRMLMSKDATIREVHHRVKNNLQTIAALLRLQGRRLKSEEAREAIQESERRIRSIAIVHETLSREASEEVDFTSIVKPLVRVVEETVSDPDGGLRFDVTGESGYVPGETATPLAVVLNELLQNAVDHAYPRVGDEPIEGTVHVHLEREDSLLEVIVTDDGVGLPVGFDLTKSPGLGTSIVHALVTGELAGTIEMANARDGDRPGTRVRVRIPVPVAGWNVEPPG
ncbi:MAG: histidine kinase N-terminal domain-containing protein [Actinomycetes bacterium]